jgi:hypothetical protein
MVASPVAGKYDKVVDRESAYEMLRSRADAAAREAQAQEGAQSDDRPSPWDKGADRPDGDADGYSRARRYDGNAKAETKPRSSSSRSDSVGEAFAKSFARQLGSRSGQALVRGILGSLFRSR